MSTSKNRLLIYAVAFVLFISLAAGAISLVTLSQLNSTQAHQNQLALTLKENVHKAALSRIPTVESRCELTHKLVATFAERAVGSTSPADRTARALPYKLSEQKCLKELITVKAIATRTNP